MSAVSGRRCSEVRGQAAAVAAQGVPFVDQVIAAKSRRRHEEDADRDLDRLISAKSSSRPYRSVNSIRARYRKHRCLER